MYNMRQRLFYKSVVKKLPKCNLVGPYCLPSNFKYCHKSSCLVTVNVWMLNHITCSVVVDDVVSVSSGCEKKSTAHVCIMGSRFYQQQWSRRDQGQGIICSGLVPCSDSGETNIYPTRLGKVLWVQWCWFESWSWSPSAAV